MRRLVLVVGAAGQLGEVMTARLGAGHEVVSRSRAELDLTVPEAVRTTVGAVCPDVIVNCSAYTNVDGAQLEPSLAFDVNAWAVRSLARAASDVDATLVHFSTDFVFDGETASPYTEADAPNPRGAYAASKLVGEWLAAETPRHFILRVESLFGGPRAKSSIDRILDGILAGAEVRAFADRTVSPSYTEDVVSATVALIERQAPFGLYHCVNSGCTTWSGLARHLATVAGRPEATIVDVAMRDARLPTPRPLFAALSNDKMTAAGVAMPSWQNAVERYVADRRAAG